MYGTSASHTDAIVYEIIHSLHPKTVVDFGAGKGKYCEMVRSLYDDCHIIAVDGFAETVNYLRGQPFCDEVYCSLIQDWIAICEKFDLAIFGDVLEHLSPNQIKNAVGQAIKKFKHVLIVVPLYNIHQDDHYGNNLEIHRAYLTETFFDRFHPIEKHIINKGRSKMVVVLSSEKIPQLRDRIVKKSYHYLMLSLQMIGLAKPTASFLKRYFSKYGNAIAPE